MEDETVRELQQMDAMFRQTCGHQAYLYSHSPNGKTRYVFTDWSTTSPEQAINHMEDLLKQAEAGERLWW